MRAGLEALSARAPDIVLVHDAARPFCSAELVSRAIVACGETGAAIPALEVTDTIKRVDAGGHVAGTVDRARASRGADAAGVQIFGRCSRRINAPPRKAATISPTTPRWPNGRASRSQHSREKAAT